MIYRNAVRPLLFSLDAEFAHERTLEMLSAAGRLPFVSSHQAFTHSRLRACVAGIEFPNPIGLAAGCDKNGRALPIWPRFGFGFVEAGTITAQPQSGNPKPRVFRVPHEGALINRLGFNSEGSTVVASRLALLRRGRPLPIPVGINIGKTRTVSGDEDTLEDYKTSFRRLAPFADYMVVNVSSPNTPGLRLWQEKAKLASLLSMLMDEASAIGETKAAGDESSGGALAAVPPVGAQNRREVPARVETGALQSVVRAPGPPLFLKISPDMNDSDLNDVVEVALEMRIGGIIATNTTVSRPGASAAMSETGGMSGRPLRERANQVARCVFRQTHGRLPLIGVGGISTAEDVYERLRSGASLVQLYTALIFEGPLLPRTLNEGLLRLMERDGIKRISDLVGADV